MSGSWLGAQGPLARIGSPKDGKLVRPGETLKIGRHADNDLVLNDLSVSRFHACVSWSANAPRPIVHDLGSQNGLVVGGCRRSEAELEDGVCVVLGARTLPVTLTGTASNTPALLEDDDDLVSSLLDQGGWEHGLLLTSAEVETLLCRLERDARSGTLEIDWPRARAKLTFAGGRILIAHSGALSGRDALDRIMTAHGASYAFRSQYCVGESCLHNVWPSSYLRQRALRQESA